MVAREPRCGPVDPRAEFPAHVQIEPMPGYHMMRFGDEYLFVDRNISTSRVVLSADMVAAVLEEIAVGRVRDHSMYGLGRMWRFCSITSAPETPRRRL